MKIRIKYSKTGSLKFIGHLDVMRYFQKAIRRANWDVKYSQGFSPHQLISFAAPLSLGVTSEGEYFDAEMNSISSSEEMINRINAVSVPEIQVSRITLLPENAKAAMASVAASDYLISARDGDLIDFATQMEMFFAQSEIMALKKTKKSEKITDIRPLIYDMHFVDHQIYMLLSTGSVNNLKPELVMESFCNYMNMPYDPFAYHVHRIETYMRNENDRLVPLSEAGVVIGNE